MSYGGAVGTEPAAFVLSRCRRLLVMKRTTSSWSITATCSSPRKLRRFTRNSPRCWEISTRYNLQNQLYAYIRVDVKYFQRKCESLQDVTSTTFVVLILKSFGYISTLWMLHSICKHSGAGKWWRFLLFSEMFDSLQAVHTPGKRRRNDKVCSSLYIYVMNVCWRTKAWWDISTVLVCPFQVWEDGRGL